MLLFKIKRSLLKRVEFSPKRGFVEPGTTCQVSITLLPVSSKDLRDQYNLTRLLVKTVTINASVLKGDKDRSAKVTFDRYWQQASRGSEVKKVVDIIDSSRSRFDPSFMDTASDDAGPITPALQKVEDLRNRLLLQSEEIFSDCASSVSSASTVQSAQPMSIRQSRVVPRSLSPSREELEGSGQRRVFPVSAPTRPWSSLPSAHDIDSAWKQEDRPVVAGSRDTVGEMYENNSSLEEKYDPSKRPFRDLSDEIVGGDKESRGEHSGVDRDPFRAMWASSSSSPTFDDFAKAREYKSSQGNSSGVAVSIPTPPQQRLLPKESNASEWVLGSSRVVLLSSYRAYRRSKEGSAPSSPLSQRQSRDLTSSQPPHLPASALLEIFGQDVTDATVRALVSSRLDELDRRGVRLSAVEVGHCDLTSLDCLLRQQDEEEEGEEEEADPWHSTLKHLSVTSCANLTGLAPVLNRLRGLVTLDLSGNSLLGRLGRAGLPVLDLPCLRTLDLSHNKLTSLDCLQMLLRLRTLRAAHNEIKSLLHSVNTLVPLSSSLTCLDLSSNPVCGDLRYAEEVLTVLPELRLFDGIDLDTFGKTYLSAFVRRTATPLRGNRRTTGQGRPAVPPLPCELTDSRRTPSTPRSHRGPAGRSTSPPATGQRGAAYASKPRYTLEEPPSYQTYVSSDSGEELFGRDRTPPSSSSRRRQSSPLTRSRWGSPPPSSTRGRSRSSSLSAPTQASLIRMHSYGYIQQRSGSGPADEADDLQSRGPGAGKSSQI